MSSELLGNTSIGTLSQNWLQVTDTSTVWPDVQITSNWTYPWYVQPYCYHYHACTCEPKIRLTLAEVNTLREAAQKSRKLKAILEKMTARIEVDLSECLD